MRMRSRARMKCTYETPATCDHCFHNFSRPATMSWLLLQLYLYALHVSFSRYHFTSHIHNTVLCGNVYLFVGTRQRNLMYRTFFQSHACNSTRANQNSSLVIEIFTDAKDTMKLTFDNNVQHVIMLTVYVNIPLNLTFMTSGSSILHIACRFHNVIYISLHWHTANLSLSHEIRRDSRDASFRQRNL